MDLDEESIRRRIEALALKRPRTDNAAMKTHPLWPELQRARDHMASKQLQFDNALIVGFFCAALLVLASLFMDGCSNGRIGSCSVLFLLCMIGIPGLLYTVLQHYKLDDARRAEQGVLKRWKEVNESRANTDQPPFPEPPRPARRPVNGKVIAK